MENFELIDQYLTGKLKGEEKVAFESKLASNPELKSEVELQKQIVTGIQKARAKELKSMLQNIPTPTPWFFETSSFKIAASLIGGGLLVTSLYFYFQPTPSSLGPSMSTSVEDTLKDSSLLDSNEPPQSNQQETSEPIKQEEESEKAPIKQSQPVPKQEMEKTEVKKPALDIVDPTSEVSSQENDIKESSSSATGIRLAQMDVETNTADKRHSFHYQFSSGKLILFGAFDKGLYEVIEINGTSKSLFLFYKNSYHTLDESKNEITPLEPVTNKELIRKLNQFRAQ